MHLLKVGHHIPKKKYFPNKKDYFCAWGVFGSIFVVFWICVIVQTMDLSHKMSTHNYVEQYTDHKALRAPDLHICHENPKLLDFINIELFPKNRSEDDLEVEEIEFSPGARSVQRKTFKSSSRTCIHFNATQVLSEKEGSKVEVRVDQSLWYGVTWQCPPNHFLDNIWEKYKDFHEILNDALEKASEKLKEGRPEGFNVQDGKDCPFWTSSDQQDAKNEIQWLRTKSHDELRSKSTRFSASAFTELEVPSQPAKDDSMLRHSSRREQKPCSTEASFLGMQNLGSPQSTSPSLEELLRQRNEDDAALAQFGFGSPLPTSSSDDGDFDEATGASFLGMQVLGSPQSTRPSLEELLRQREEDDAALTPGTFGHRAGSKSLPTNFFSAPKSSAQSGTTPISELGLGSDEDLISDEDSMSTPIDKLPQQRPGNKGGKQSPSSNEQCKRPDRPFTPWCAKYTHLDNPTFPPQYLPCQVANAFDKYLSSTQGLFCAWGKRLAIDEYVKAHNQEDFDNAFVQDNLDRDVACPVPKLPPRLEALARLSWQFTVLTQDYYGGDPNVSGVVPFNLSRPSCGYGDGAVLGCLRFSRKRVADARKLIENDHLRRCLDGTPDSSFAAQLNFQRVLHNHSLHNQNLIEDVKVLSKKMVVALANARKDPKVIQFMQGNVDEHGSNVQTWKQQETCAYGLVTNEKTDIGKSAMNWLKRPHDFKVSSMMQVSTQQTNDNPLNAIYAATVSHGDLFPDERTITGFSFRASLANYTEDVDDWGTSHELLTPLRLPFKHSTFVHADGEAKTWRWKDSLGGRYGASHKDTDYLSLSSLKSASKEKGSKKAAALIEFTYMKSGIDEEVFVNEVMSSVVSFIQGILGLVFMFVLVPQIFFKEVKEETWKYFRFDLFGLGKKAVPLEDLPESERKKEELKRKQEEEAQQQESIP